MSDTVFDKMSQVSVDATCAFTAQLLNSDGKEGARKLIKMGATPHTLAHLLLTIANSSYDYRDVTDDFIGAVLRSSLPSTFILAFCSQMEKLPSGTYQPDSYYETDDLLLNASVASAQACLACHSIQFQIDQLGELLEKRPELIHPETLERVCQYASHPDFSLSNYLKLFSPEQIEQILEYKAEQYGIMKASDLAEQLIESASKYPIALSTLFSFIAQQALLETELEPNQASSILSSFYWGLSALDAPLSPIVQEALSDFVLKTAHLPISAQTYTYHFPAKLTVALSNWQIGQDMFIIPKQLTPHVEPLVKVAELSQVLNYAPLIQACASQQLTPDTDIVDILTQTQKLALQLQKKELEECKDEFDAMEARLEALHLRNTIGTHTLSIKPAMKV